MKISSCPLLRPFGLLLLLLSGLSPALAAERVVDLAVADGTKLKATYFSAAQPGPGVLLLHQCNRQRKVWDDLARQLAAAGINVLTFDQRGFGESDGDRFDKMSPEQRTQAEAKRPEDIETAFRYLESQPGVARDRIGVGGASCGVHYSLQTAQNHPEVKALVLLSGPANFKDRQFLRNSPKLPVFLSAADDDEFPDSPPAIEWLYSLTPNPGKKYVHYKTGGHGADMFPSHPDLPAMIVNWYVTTLIKTPGRAPASKETVAIDPAVKILEMIDQPGGPARASQKLHARHDSKAPMFPEAAVNQIGYEHLLGGDGKGALEIMKLNAEAYPKSPNVYDSLGDIYLAEGQKDLARQSCKKALELLSSDTADSEERKGLIRASSEQKLKQLGDPPR